jgi:hypothetical protein
VVERDPAGDKHVIVSRGRRRDHLVNVATLPELTLDRMHSGAIIDELRLYDDTRTAV